MMQKSTKVLEPFTTGSWTWNSDNLLSLEVSTAQSAQCALHTHMRLTSRFHIPTNRPHSPRRTDVPLVLTCVVCTGQPTLTYIARCQFYILKEMSYDNFQGIRDFVFRDPAESQVACRRKLKWLNLLDLMVKVTTVSAFTFNIA